MQAWCQVRKVKIRTDEQALLPRITFLLEDALRTASFPGLLPNGVVYIKSLNLGRLPSDISSGRLSDKIDAFIKNLRPERAESDNAQQADVAAVWFADELEPYRLLADRLTRGHTPEAWYWPVAVKGWSPQHSVLHGLQVIMGEVARKPTGLSGLVHVLAPLLEDDRLLDLFAAVEQQTVTSLMASVGLTPVMVSQAPLEALAMETTPTEGLHPFDALKHRYQDLIYNAVKRWGALDARVNLICCLVLSASGQAVTPRLATRATKKAVGKLEHPSQIPTEDTAPIQNDSIPDRPFSGQTKPDHVRSDEKKHAPAVPPTKITDSFQKKEHRPETVTGDSRSLRPDIEGGDKAKTERDSVNLSFGNLVDDEKIGPADQPESPDRIEKQFIPELPANENAVIDQATPPADLSCDEKQSPAESMNGLYPFTGQFSEYAGFPFLVTVLDKLGFEDILSGQADYPATIMAPCILRRFAAWQKIPVDDPVLRFLTKKADLLPQADDCKHPFNRQTILDAARDDIKNMFRIPQSCNPLQPLNFNQVRHVFVIAACRYIHKRAKMTVRRLIKRPANIALTKTHMDITSSMQNLDIRIRLAGLDINPGWVPWLGRVIQFHYSQDE